MALPSGGQGCPQVRAGKGCSSAPITRQASDCRCHQCPVPSSCSQSIRPSPSSAYLSPAVHLWDHPGTQTLLLAWRRAPRAAKASAFLLLPIGRATATGTRQGEQQARERACRRGRGGREHTWLWSFPWASPEHSKHPIHPKAPHGANGVVASPAVTDGTGSVPHFPPVPFHSAQIGTLKAPGMSTESAQIRAGVRGCCRSQGSSGPVTGHSSYECIVKPAAFSCFPLSEGTSANTANHAASIWGVSPHLSHECS